LGISLLNITKEAFTQLVPKYLVPYIEEILGEYQCCFRRNPSASGQIFSLRKLLEKPYDYNVDINKLHIDYKQTCNSKGKVHPCTGTEVKCTLVQTLRLCTGRTAHKGSTGIALLYRH
jgi:hypothetical protein